MNFHFPELNQVHEEQKDEDDEEIPEIPTECNA